MLSVDGLCCCLSDPNNQLLSIHPHQAIGSLLLSDEQRYSNTGSTQKDRRCLKVREDDLLKIGFI